MADELKDICRKCGASENFRVTESYTWDAELENGALTCTNAQSQILKIECTNCGKQYKLSDFDRVDFN